MKSVKEHIVHVPLGSGDALELNLYDLPSGIRLKLLENGAERRLRDAARQRGPDAARRLARAWVAGHWSLRDGKRRRDPLALAVSAAFGMDYDTAAHQLSELNAAERKELREDPEVAGQYAYYKAVDKGRQPGRAADLIERGAAVDDGDQDHERERGGDGADDEPGAEPANPGA